MSGSVEPNGAEIIRRRRERAWTQHDLAGKSGLSKRAIESIEKGKSCALPSVRAIAEAFGVEPGDLAPELVGQFAEESEEGTKALRKWINSFWALIEDKTADFVGRKFVFDALDGFVADGGTPSGYFIIRGQPGIGKTAIMSQLVKTRSCVHHFNVAPQGINTARHFLTNVCAQLIVRHGLGWEELPDDVHDDGRFLNKVLEEVSRRLGGSAQVLIAVDALDEVSQSSSGLTANTLFLPSSLPRGIFFVVTTRPIERLRLEVSRARTLDLEASGQDNVRDVEEYVRSRISEEGIRAWWESQRIAEEEFVDALVKKSEGNFMYLYHVLNDVGADGFRGISADRLPNGLVEYYHRHWEKMRNGRMEQFDRVHKPIVCVLAASLEPVTASQIADWSNRELSEVTQTLRDWREFITTERDECEIRYRIYHTSFQDFLRDRVDPGFHTSDRMIVTSALGKVRKAKSDKSRERRG